MFIKSPPRQPSQTLPPGFVAVADGYMDVAELDDPSANRAEMIAPAHKSIVGQKSRRP
jgi:hypothetical protein